MEKQPAIELVNITKTFGPQVVANKNVNLTAYRGEILSILGENGSGKTTLMNMISGIYFPDEGQIFINGEEVTIASPKDAFDYKIGMIHQHFKLVDVFTATENIVLGLEKPKVHRLALAKNYKQKQRECERTLKEQLNALEQDRTEFKQALDERAATEGCTQEELDRIWAEFTASLAERTDACQNEYALALEACKNDYEQNLKDRKQACKEGKFNIKKFSEEIRQISEQYGFDIDPNKKIYDMSVSEKQTVEIIKVLYRGADILILDEPTAVLTPQETQKLFAILRRMRDDGKCIIIITHKLHEVLSLSDRVSVLRKGEYIGTVNTSETSEDQLTEMMVGKKVELNIHRSEPVNAEDRLEIKDISCVDRQGVTVLDKVSFTARSGEILGIAGIAGSGQRELLEAIAGLQHLTEGDIYYHNPKTGQVDDLRNKTPIQIRELGVRLSFVPEDRLGMGLVGNMDIVDNMMLRSYRKGNSMFLHRKNPKDLAERIIADLEVVTPSASTPVRRLSGGNVQKVLVGREISSAPKVLMTAYPVRGLDINSSYTIYNLLNQQKEIGTAVIFVGEDLDVLLELCDRILVICGGRITGLVDARTATKEQIGLLMTKTMQEGESENGECS